MEKLNVTYLALHDPLFIGGTNFGNSIDTKHKTIKIELDYENHYAILQYKNKIVVMPTTNIKAMEVSNPEILGIKPELPKTYPTQDIAKTQAEMHQFALMAQAQKQAMEVKSKPQAANVSGRKKIMSHAELDAVIAAEKAQA